MDSARRPLNEQLRQRVLSDFEDLGYTILDAGSEQNGPCSITERQRKSDVVLGACLRRALLRLNPDKPVELINKAIEQLAENRNLRSLAQANYEVYQLLKDGVKLAPPDASSPDEKVTIQFIDWGEESGQHNNDFLLVTNFWLDGTLGPRRLDFVGFVNGLPWLLPVVRSAERQNDPLRTLYGTVISDYKRQFPQLFWYNALILLSDGRQSKVGSMTAPWEHFVEWKKVEREDEPEDTSLETLLRGTCAKARLLDVVENFTLFSQEPGGLIKIVGRYHQLLGVNAAYARMLHIKELDGKIGVFWHTQGAGKSYSMIFFEQKVQRKIREDWTFVIVTDREDLDYQIYCTFSYAGAVSEPEEQIRASDRQAIKRLLGEEKHSIIFTLIQKFGTDQPGQRYEQLSDRDNIIVMTDEAHRSEYDTLAGNMRAALPNASFIGFTGTPLIEDEEHETRTTFGPYISKYPFLQAVKDGVTVRLIYENRTPEIVPQRIPQVAQELQRIEDSLRSEEEKRKLRAELFQKQTILESSARLDFVANDIVEHFMNRGFMGKAMVISDTKLLTVRTYNRVKHAWERYQAQLEQTLQQETDLEQREKLAEKIAYMKSTEMAVVFSDSEGEDEKQRIEDFNKEHPQEQIDFEPHYDLFRKKKLDDRFKNENDPLRIVFVCSMWITGFDVKCLSTLYLDHPMKKHTLMQAIARPNRTYGSDKTCGQVVDYVGIYPHLLRALNIYARPEQGIGAADLDMPLREKSELIDELEQTLSDLATFCQQYGINVQKELAALEKARSKALKDAQIKSAANALLIKEDVKLNYLNLAQLAYNLYQALLPGREANRFALPIYFYHQIRQAIVAAMNCASIDDVMVVKARTLIAEALDAKQYDNVQHLHDPDVIIGKFDLTALDFDALAASMQAQNAYLQAERLRSLATGELQRMIRINPKRVDLEDRLNEIIRKNNEMSANNANYPEDIIEFLRELREESLRHQREGLSEQELAIVDLLASADRHLAATDYQQVKTIARELLKELVKSGKLVHNWYNKPAMDSGVRQLIKNTLAKLPTSAYTVEQYHQLWPEVYNYIRASYENDGGDDSPISA